MELILIIGGLMLLSGLTFIIIEKPFYFAALLIFMMIYIFNVQIPGPLDARGLLLLVLFLRLTFFDKENLPLITGVLFKNPFFYLALTFVVLTFIITFTNEGSLKLSLKDQVLSIISLIMGFVMLSSKKGRNAFIFGLITAGLISVFDLVLHYTRGGVIEEKFTIFRLLDLITLTPFEYQWGTNHGFPGYLSGTAFIFVYVNHSRKSWGKKYTIPLMVLLGTGVFLSTSRSTLISIILIMFYINLSQGILKINFRKIIFSTATIIFVYASVYFYYNLALKGSSPSDSLVHKAYYRLYEEPLQIFTDKGKKFDIYTGESIETSSEFRMEKATTDINNFFSKDLFTQMFGYGRGGYKYIGQRIFQENDNSYILGAHNGYVVLLVESGVIGLFIFILLTLGLIKKSAKINRWKLLDFPVFYLYLMLMIYVIGQNGELTNSLSFLMIGGMIANVSVIDFEHEQEKLEETIDDQEPNLVNSN